MKSCKDCKYADWQKTVSGKLHPSGSGKCGFVVSIPALPASMYWFDCPRPNGGSISRKETLKEHCVYVARDVK